MQTSAEGNCIKFELQPVRYLQAAKSESQAEETALVILNAPLTDYVLLTRLWAHSSYRICADGGANRLHDLVVNTPDNQSQKRLTDLLPDAIRGDLDSITQHVRKRYEDLGVEISQDPDQYSTDLGKCIDQILRRKPGVTEILVLGSLGGRVDHGISVLHEFYREQKFKHPDIRFWLFSEQSVSVIIPSGTTVIETPLESGLITRNIGILPVYGKAVISTTGLEWDVKNWPTQLGTQVSTSNHIIAKQISITTDVEVLFTVERTTTW